MSPLRAWTSSSAAIGHVALVSFMTGSPTRRLAGSEPTSSTRAIVVTPGWARATPPCTYSLARPASTIHAHQPIRSGCADSKSKHAAVFVDVTTRQHMLPPSTARTYALPSRHRCAHTTQHSSMASKSEDVFGRCRAQRGSAGSPTTLSPTYHLCFVILPSCLPPGLVLWGLITRQSIICSHYNYPLSLPTTINYGGSRPK